MGFGIWELLCTQERVTEPLDHTIQVCKTGSRRWKMGIAKRERERERDICLLINSSKWVIIEYLKIFEEEEIQAWKGVIADMAVSEPKVVLRIWTNVKVLLGKIQEYVLKVRGTCHLVDNCCLTFQATFFVITFFFLNYSVKKKVTTTLERPR